MRNLFLALLAANLLFLAWARWVDTPPEPTRQDAVARLPRLLLVTEAPPAPKPTSDSAQKMDFREAGLPADCISVGPFNDMTSAARTAAALTDRGFRLHQRAEEGEAVEGYWVYVGGMQTDDEVTQVVQRLDKSGFTDAHIMRESSEGRRVSVGMFSKRERADRRALAVKHMGLNPEVAERRFPGTVYWVDVTVPAERQLPAEVLQGDSTTGSVGAQDCPASESPAPEQRLAPSRTLQARDGAAGRAAPRTKVASAPGVP
ncbi:MAG TPA: SPOR domain-containing protein [Steroidobacteraceae bacterium]|nr:SPOR domain-containing protein [Steroidobacteraceae bacterium]